MHPASVCLYLVVITLVIFSPVTRYGFINYDDPEYVTDNPRVQGGMSWDNVGWAFRAGYASNWHPLTWLSHMLDSQWFGRGAAGPHGVNLLLHAANAVLLFLLLRQVTGALWRSAFVAGLFAWHPLHVESVAWVAERKDVLSTLFGLLTIWAYAKYVESKGAAKGSRVEGRGEKGEARVPDGESFTTVRQSRITFPALVTPKNGEGRLRFTQRVRGWYALTLVFFALGLMSKPMLVTLPFVMLLVDFWPLRRSAEWGVRSAELEGGRLATWNRLLLEKTPFLLLSAASCVITVVVQQKAMQPLLRLSLEQRIETAVVSYARYLGKTFWPTDLALPYPQPGHWPWGEVLLAGVLVVGLSGGAVLWGRRVPFAFTGWFWYLGMLVPVIGLVQVGDQAMADRYTYLPLVGVFILVTWGAAELAARIGRPASRRLEGVALPVGLTAGAASRSARTQAEGGDDVRSRAARGLCGVGGVAVLAVLGILARQQVNLWRADETLFGHAFAVTENNYVALGNIGVSFFDRGRFDEAIEYYHRSLLINPYNPDALNNMGAALAGKGEHAAAITWFRRALQWDPAKADAQFNLGNALANQGQYAEAVPYFETALEKRADRFEAHNNLANALLKLGRIDDAIRHYRLALQFGPNAAKIHKNLAAVLLGKGKVEEAVLHYRQALILEPKDASTHYSLGLALAIQGRWDEAIEQYTESLRFGPDNPEVQYNLGYAFRTQGRLDEAASHLNEALRLKADFPLAHFNLGCVLADQGQRDQAATHLKEALRLQPQYPEATERLRRLGTSAEKGGL